MRAALILDSSPSVRIWQFEALRSAIERGLEVQTLAYCDNTVRPRKRLKYAGYYAMSLLARRRMTSNSERDVRELVGALDVQEFHFEAETEGAWQRLPQSVAKRLGDHDVVIRFGMNLIRDPESIPTPLGIVSYHHGDPSQFRGRPAGFYELRENAPTMGIIVQRLSNDLDGGVVLARARVRVVAHSYAKTLDAAAWAGVPLLSNALFHPEPAPQPVEVGKLYTLPNTRVVVAQGIRMLGAALTRTAYGALREKSWRTGFVTTVIDLSGDVELTSADVTELPTPYGSTFVADPISEDEESVYCEAMDSRSGIGSLVRWDVGHSSWQPVLLPGFKGHASYPCIVRSGQNQYLLPEIASQSAPTLFKLSDDGLTIQGHVSLTGLEGTRIVDPTLFKHGGNWFLFGGLPKTCAHRLDLWTSKDLVGPYRPHSASPICLDVRGARMAGPILVHGDRMFRFGQDNSLNYGGSVTVYRIDVLDGNHYSESRVGRVSFTDSWGPHTLSFTEKGAWVDYYRERWTPLAGWRRVRALVLKRLLPA